MLQAEDTQSIGINGTSATLNMRPFFSCITQRPWHQTALHFRFVLSLQTRVIWSA